MSNLLIVTVPVIIKFLNYVQLYSWKTSPSLFIGSEWDSLALVLIIELSDFKDVMLEASVASV